MGLRVLVLLFALVGALAQSPLKYEQKPWNVRGEVLVLDVSSLSYQGNHPMFPTLSKPEQCGFVCSATPGCNAWTYCNATEGCGSGCLAYTAKNPQLKTRTDQGPAGMYSRNPSWALPLTSFGPWGPTSGCKNTFDSAKNTWVAGDKYPQGMCSLKVVTKPATPAWWTKDPSQGWVSGVIPIPGQCFGTSAGACEGCLMLKNATQTASCLECAKSKAVMPGNLAQWVGSQTPVGAACVTCYSKSSNTSRCLDCINKGGACAACPEQTYAKGDVDACITCSNKMGKAYSNSCLTCALVSGGKGAADKCIGCLQKTKKFMCKPNVYSGDVGYNCTMQSQATDACATCATSAADFKQCEKCVTTAPFSSGCADCALLSGGAQAQAKCYSCRATSKVWGTACSDCPKYLKDTAEQGVCSSCLANPKISGEAKTWCYACTQWYPQKPALQAKCVECLGTQKNPGGACSKLA